MEFEERLLKSRFSGTLLIGSHQTPSRPWQIMYGMSAILYTSFRFIIKFPSLYMCELNTYKRISCSLSLNLHWFVHMGRVICTCWGFIAWKCHTCEHKEIYVYISVYIMSLCCSKVDLKPLNVADIIHDIRFIISSSLIARLSCSILTNLNWFRLIPPAHR